MHLLTIQSFGFTVAAHFEKIFSYSKTGSAYLDRLFYLIQFQKPFFDYLKSDATEQDCLTFPDHHHFTDKDLLDIKNKAKNRIIITTEKDYVRLQDTVLSEQLFYLPIKSRFVTGEASFDRILLQYVSKSSVKP